MISVPRWPYLDEPSGNGPENTSGATLGGDPGRAGYRCAGPQAWRQ